MALRLIRSRLEYLILIKEQHNNRSPVHHLSVRNREPGLKFQGEISVYEMSLGSLGPMIENLHEVFQDSYQNIGLHVVERSD